MPAIWHWVEVFNSALDGRIVVLPQRAHVAAIFANHAWQYCERKRCCESDVNEQESAPRDEAWLGTAEIGAYEADAECEHDGHNAHEHPAVEAVLPQVIYYMVLR